MADQPVPKPLTLGEMAIWAAAYVRHLEEYNLLPEAASHADMTVLQLRHCAKGWNDPSGLEAERVRRGLPESIMPQPGVLYRQMVEVES
jgi:hypothetical protein